jgi:hypothetical protein
MKACIRSSWFSAPARCSAKWESRFDPKFMEEPRALADLVTCEPAIADAQVCRKKYCVTVMKSFSWQGSSRAPGQLTTAGRIAGASDRQRHVPQHAGHCAHVFEFDGLACSRLQDKLDYWLDRRVADAPHVIADQVQVHLIGARPMPEPLCEGAKLFGCRALVG